MPNQGKKRNALRLQHLIIGLLMLAAFVGMYYWLLPDKHWQGIKVISGQTDNIQFPDGSTAFMIGPAQLGYSKNFHQKVKKVKMEGEIYFEIIPNADHHFVIQSEAGGVETHGAHLLLNSTENKRLTVHCLQGNARMIARGKKEILEIDLSENEMCDFIRGDGKLAKKKFEVKNLQQLTPVLNTADSSTHSTQRSVK